MAYEVILVDNNSTDVPASNFTSRFTEIKLIALPENIGFGPANNLGMQSAQGKYILLLNPDTLVEDDSIQRCFRFMESAEAQQMNAGLLGCKIVGTDGKPQNSVFPYLKNTLSVYLLTINPVVQKIARILGRDKHAAFDGNKLQQVGDVSGAYMFILQTTARETGMFDSDFFLYYEDSEWCRERISKTKNIVYFPEAHIVHIGGQSGPQDIMYIQSKLSLSLLWYKKGWPAYVGYIVITYLSVITTWGIMPFTSATSRTAMLQFTKAYTRLFSYLFTDITRYPRTMHARKERLIYKEARSAMNIK
jgi:GT2 family glycosyltransferase